MLYKCCKCKVRNHSLNNLSFVLMCSCGELFVGSFCGESFAGSSCVGFLSRESLVRSFCGESLRMCCSIFGLEMDLYILPDGCSLSVCTILYRRVNSVWVLRARFSC